MLDQFVRSRQLRLTLIFLLVGAGLAAIAYGAGLFNADSNSLASASPSMEPEERPIPASSPGGPEERLIPTPSPSRPDERQVPTPSPSGQNERHVPTPSPSEAVPEGTSVPPTLEPHARLATRTTEQTLYSPRERVGFVAPMRDVEQYDVAQLGAGWHISCQEGEDPVPDAGMECAQLVGVTGGTSLFDLTFLREIAAKNPGRLWLVGNEPDVIWQLNTTPEDYARLYHDVHKTIKEADPTSQVAIGGISQVTPLRLRYLDEVLAAYAEAYGQQMPVDVWNIHLAILREERGSWGVDIPPGMPGDTGTLYEIEDNGNVEILKSQVATFRRWMADRGFRNKPLIVTEFSVLMPPEYGFPQERVQAFLTAAFDFLLTATDAAVGYHADGDRLVQRWAWYSVADRVYSTGNLFDPDTGQMTALGEAFASWVAAWEQ